MDVGTTGTGQCTHDGVLCNGCGSCCSKNCGPWALPASTSASRASAARSLNSLCTSDSECCGSSSGPGPLHARFRRQRQHRRLLDEHREPGAGRDLPADRRRQRLLQRPERLRRARSRPRRSAAPTTRSACRAASARAPAATAGWESSAEPIPSAAGSRDRRATPRRSAAASALRPRLDRDAALPDHHAERRRHRLRRRAARTARRRVTAAPASSAPIDGEGPDLRPAVHAAARRRRRLRALRPGLQRQHPLLQRRPVHLFADQQRVQRSEGCTCYTPL